MLCFRKVEFVNAVGKIGANDVRNINDVLWNVPRCTALISTRLGMMDGLLPVQGESDTLTAALIEQCRICERHRWIVKGQLCSKLIFGLLLVFSLFLFPILVCVRLCNKQNGE